jgi:preprotein translocase subunit YajC
MIDVILIVLDIVCLIAFIYFIHCEKENTKARKEQTKQLKKENELLDEIIRMWNR